MCGGEDANEQGGVVQVSHKQHFIVFVEGSWVLQIWDVAAEQLKCEFLAHETGVSCLGLAPGALVSSLSDLLVRPQRHFPCLTFVCCVGFCSRG